MDKPSQTKPYAGLIIYRINRNVEYLLLNDSFTNKKHWFCPKGQVIGSEDEIKCALRETFEATGLRPSELRIEEGFAIELKYLSGTKPKKVKYHLAQLLDNHVRLLPNAEGVHMQWFNQTISSEKVIFKSMQDVFKHAQTFIESKQQRRNNKHSSSYDRHHSNNSNNNSSTTAINPITAATPISRNNTSVTTATANEVKSPVTSAQDNTTTTHKSSYNNKPRNSQQQQQQQQQHLQQQASPLYKTRLCERFETEGSCPYGLKCNFAHGIVELRGRDHQLQQQQEATQQDAAAPSPTSSNTTAANTSQMIDSGNQLFKTRLCEKFMKENFCQYGPKCHFAHGEHELKERPKKAEELETARSTPPLPRTRNNIINNSSENINVDTHDSPDQRDSWRTGGNQNEYNNRSTETSWRPNHNNVDRPIRTRSPSSEDEVLPNHTVGRANREGNWRSTTPTLASSLKTPPPVKTTVPTPAPTTPPPVAVTEKKEKEQVTMVKENPSVLSVVEELHRPAFVEHQIRPTTITVNKKASIVPTFNNNNKEKKAMVAPVTTEKSWMKVVKLSKEEQDEINAMQQSNSKTYSPGKSAQTESIISDLKKFFINHVNCTAATKGKLTEDVKEVTKIEMRNDLSKKQLLYILLVSLLEDTDSLVPILKYRDHLFKTLVKTNADQILLLKAWENFVTQRKPIMVNKTAVALSHWYDCEMIEEEAFVQWYDTLEKESTLEKKSVKFIEWLNSSDDEEDEDED